MKVNQLIKILEKMPKNADVGIASHDYDLGVSDDISSVSCIDDEELLNSNSGRDKPDHRVVIFS